MLYRLPHGAVDAAEVEQFVLQMVLTVCTVSHFQMTLQLAYAWYLNANAISVKYMINVKCECNDIDTHKH